MPGARSITELYQSVELTSAQRRVIRAQVELVRRELGLGEAEARAAMLLCLRRWQGDHGMRLAEVAAMAPTRRLEVHAEVTRNLLELLGRRLPPGKGELMARVAAQAREHYAACFAHRPLEEPGGACRVRDNLEIATAGERTDEEEGSSRER